MEELADAEIERRVLAGLPAEIELFGSSSPSARVIRSGGVIASVSPATPDRSLFSSVYAADTAELSGVLDELASVYEEAGVRAWTVWIPAGDSAASELLAARGHVLDGTPRSMGVELSGFRPSDRSLPEGVELRPAGLAEVGTVNDAAYGLDRQWGTALAGEPTIDVRWLVAAEGGRAIACAGTIDVDDDTCITGVATLPESQGSSLAAIVIAALLADAAGRGIRTASLQASKMGAPVYAKLGFRDVGHTQMWEHRSGEPGSMPHH